MNYITSLSHISQAFFATVFTWGITCLGAGLVFFFKTPHKNIMDGILGFSAGVMIAASFWSLLSPAMDMASALGLNAWLTGLVGFLGGGLLLFTGDKLYAFSEKKSLSENTGSRKRCLMLITSITLHNIPEGMAVGVAFGSVSYGLEGATLAAACLLALGIGIQNFPEGTAVSVPLRREGLSRKKAFLLGSLSGAVEPVSGVFGALLVMKARVLLPYLLSFAAGAMIYVVVEELIPESQTNEKKDIMALFTLVGFSVMMVLDIALS